ncbi:MAG TPA: LacI family DNA-binding transcriptional regulator [Ilumatobacteraceae bacterium]|nr:LacI family DNA-binding transcriptional regulator [Ilumatobacteraceae bacterium]
MSIPERRTRATLADVAAQAGVSSMTVSRVVNNSSLISDNTRLRVEAAMEKVGYVPNSLARGLVVRRTDVIALIVADIMHSWFTELGHQIEVEATALGLLLVFGNTDDVPQTEVAYVDKFSSLQVDGMIIAPASAASIRNVEVLHRRGIPLVLIDREVKGVEVDVVRGDSYSASKQLTTHLIDHGYREIAMVSGPQDVWTANERVRGYRSAMKAAGLQPPKDAVVRAPFTRDGGRHAGSQLLVSDARPRAVVAGNSSLALGVLDVATELGLRVPDEFSIVTFDHVDSSPFPPFLTCYSQPAKEIGSLALKMLLERLQGLDAAPRRAVLPGQLHVYGSCGNH